MSRLKRISFVVEGPTDYILLDALAEHFLQADDYVLTLAGIGSVMGSFAGGIIIGVAEGIGSIFLSSAYTDAYGLVFLVLILLFKPAGLFDSNR